MNLFQVTKKQDIKGYELRTMTGDIVSFTPSYSQLLPDPFSDLNVKVNVLATGGNGTPDNPNPINGYTEANITRCGVNLFDKDGGNIINAYLSTKIEALAVAKTVFAKCKPSTQYTVSKTAGQRFIVAYTKELPALNVPIYGVVQDGTASHITITTGVDAKYIVAMVYNGNVDSGTADEMLASVQIAEGTDTTYHPYTGNTYTVSFGQTVYGGVLDVTRGKLHVTFKKVHLTSSLSYMYGGSAGNIWYSANDAYQPTTTSESGLVISSHFKAVTQSAMGSNDNCLCKTQNNAVIWIKDTTEGWTDVATFKTWLDTQDANNNPVEVAFKLATPFDIDLTPEQIEALLGVNNVYADCGNVTVTCLI